MFEFLFPGWFGDICVGVFLVSVVTYLGPSITSTPPSKPHHDDRHFSTTKLAFKPRTSHVPLGT